MTTPAQQRAAKAWRTRLARDGGAQVTFYLLPALVLSLERVRRPDESRPACIKRLIAEAAARI